MISNVLTDTNLNRVSPISRVALSDREPRQNEQYTAKRLSGKPFSEVLANEISHTAKKSSAAAVPEISLHSLNSLRSYYR